MNMARKMLEEKITNTHTHTDTTGEDDLWNAGKQSTQE